VDIYSFGMCVLEMITRDYPYCECNSSAQIYLNVQNGILPQSLKKVENQLAHDFILLCIQYDKEKRLRLLFYFI
jgi:serine/threonine protein kinase